MENLYVKKLCLLYFFNRIFSKLHNFSDGETSFRLQVKKLILYILIYLSIIVTLLKNHHAQVLKITLTRF